MEIKGRSLLTGLPVRVNVSTSDLYDPVMMLSEQIGTAAHQVLEKTPARAGRRYLQKRRDADRRRRPAHGLPEYLSQELKVDVYVSPDPVNCVAPGHCHEPEHGRQAGGGLHRRHPPDWPPLSLSWDCKRKRMQ